MTAPTPAVVVLCGSARFPVELAATERALTLAGHVVLGVTPFADLSAADVAVLDEVHRRKIAMADLVVVVAPGGYVGESTRGEIAYAEGRGVPVEYRDPWALTPGSGRNGLEAMLALAARRVESIPDSHRTISKHNAPLEVGAGAFIESVPTPAATATTWTPEERDLAFQLLPNSLRAASPSPYLSDRILDAVVPTVADREAAAYARGRDEGRAEEAERHLAESIARTKRVGELRTEADEILAVVTAVADENDELRRLVAGLEAENDNYHADLIRVIGERDAALAKVDAVKALAESRTAEAAIAMDPADCSNSCAAGPCDCSGIRRPIAWGLDPEKVLRALEAGPIPSSDTLAADPQRPGLPPEDTQETRTPAPGSPGTPGTLSVPLSAPQDPHGA